MVYVVFENPAGYPRQLRCGPYHSVQVLGGELVAVEKRHGTPQLRCLAYGISGRWHVRDSAEGPGSTWDSVRFDTAGEV
jgi:hypothetical protein